MWRPENKLCCPSSVIVHLALWNRVSLSLKLTKAPGIYTRLYFHQHWDYACMSLSRIWVLRTKHSCSVLTKQELYLVSHLPSLYFQCCKLLEWGKVNLHTQHLPRFHCLDFPLQISFYFLCQHASLSCSSAVDPLWLNASSRDKGLLRDQQRESQQVLYIPGTDMFVLYVD